MVLSQYKIFLIDTLDFVGFVSFLFCFLFCYMAGSHLFKWMAFMLPKIPRMKAHLFIRN